MALTLSGLEKKYPGLIKILLKDQTTKRNIILATAEYPGLSPTTEIIMNLVTPFQRRYIQARFKKTNRAKINRTKEKAEVFTPLWVVNKQNDLVDEAWFKTNSNFSTSFIKNKKEIWLSTKKGKAIKFKEGKSWQQYVKNTVLEIACGEAPYLTSRYHTDTGVPVKSYRRIGLLDRKLKIINQFATTEKDFEKYSIAAIKATYGVDWAGDSLFIARENIMLTFIEHWLFKFKEFPSQELVTFVATIISWNLWQMDLTRLVTPYSCTKTCYGCKKNKLYIHDGVTPLLIDWTEDISKSKRFSILTLLQRSEEKGNVGNLTFGGIKQLTLF